MNTLIIGLLILGIFGVYKFMIVPHSEAKKKRMQKFCDCDSAEFTRTVDEDYNPICGRCGKPLRK